jgi:transglycosylase-like protein with SLT domain
MSLLTIKSVGQHLTIASLLLVIVSAAAGQRRSHAKKNVVTPAAPENTKPTGKMLEPQVIGKEIRFADGSTIKADEVWKSGDDYWYRLGGVTQRAGRSVKSVEPIVVAKPAEPAAGETTVANSTALKLDSFWVMLKGGARMKVDDVDENEEGAWCRRGNFSFLIARDRIDRIERDSNLTVRPGWRVRDWTTGNPRVDQLIKANGNRFGVDPYLVFCVIEHESHFKSRAVSPKGAQGLMQLMPATAARFGVRNPFDPAENIYGGTQYLKGLLKMFGRVDLALASYNAGEGAVLKYGGKIPPYRETREYVKRISNRYGVDPGRSQERRPVSPE